MKISFQTTQTPEMENQRTERQGGASRSQHTSVPDVSYGHDKNQSRWTVGNNGSRKGKTMADLQMEAANQDVDIMQDYRTLLSNTMSQEDYAKLEKEGFDFKNISPEEAVTIVDKIKAELVRAGKHIAGYTDDLDMDTLAAAVGSVTLAQAISDSFQSENVPLTEDNIEQVSLAWNMMAKLKQPTDAGYAYMVENEMEPQIWDYYRAQNSGAVEGAGHPRYYAEDVQGYYMESASNSDKEVVWEEIDKALVREGVTPDETNRQRADLALEAGIPLSRENLERLEWLQQVTFPVTEEDFAKAVSVALAEGEEAVFADLTETESIYTKATAIYESYMEKYEISLSVQGQTNLTARRQLEEIRLHMTAEVNVKLLKSGFSIDTAPIEELIEALKQAEQEVAARYFPDDPQAVDKYQLYQKTEQTVDDIPTLPAQILGSYQTIEEVSLEEFHVGGAALRDDYHKANESYEALMTAPRPDLGDSIRKAFANVDDILQDLQMPLTEENRRAVRILGYNRMEITEDNLSRVIEAQSRVERVVNKMTPAAVLKMIRDGINPLNSSFGELEQYFDSLPQEYQDTAERYSRFLYSLERNQEITEGERESFIGIYRLLHQIDVSDGAAVGALVNSNAQIHFANLLSAVRSGKFKALDVTVSDNFGSTEEVIRNGKSISEQIAKGFEEEYRQMQLEQIRQAATVEDIAVALLDRAGMPASADNLLASSGLLHQSRSFYKDWLEKKESYTDADLPEEKPTDERKAGWTEIVESLDDKEAFGAAYGDMLEEMKSTVEEFTFQRVEKSMDVQALQMTHKQLGILGALSDSEEYMIPMYLDGELTNVHLRMEHGKADDSMVHIALSLTEEEQVEAQFTVNGSNVSGFLTGNTKMAVTKLKEIADIFSDSLHMTGNDWKLEKLPVVQTDTRTRTTGSAGSGEMFYGKTTDGVKDADSTQKADNRELYQLAKQFIMAVKQQGKR